MINIVNFRMRIVNIYFQKWSKTTVTIADKNYLWNFNKGSGDEIKKILNSKII